MSEAPSSLRRRCRVWREGRSGGYANPCRGYGYANPCRGYGYEHGSARTYPYPYPRDTHHVTRAGYPYPWYSLTPFSDKDLANLRNSLYSFGEHFREMLRIEARVWDPVHGL